MTRRAMSKAASALVLALAATGCGAKRGLQGRFAITRAVSSHARPEGIPEGYEYDGPVSVPSDLDPIPRLAPKGEAERPSSRRPTPGFHTVLITRDGHRYTKPLVHAPHDPEDGFGEPHIPAAPLGDKLRARALLQAAEFQADPSGQGDAGNVAPEVLPPAGPGQPPASGNTSIAGQPQSLAYTYSADYSCVGCSGADTRVRVADASAFPYSAVGRFMGQLADSNSALECSGTLIGPRHVLTAAHCVFDIHGSRKKVTAMDFAPCQNGPTPLCGTYQASNLRLLTLFTSEPEYNPTAINYDFALITLKTAAGSQLGYLGMQRGTGSSTVNLESMGYPADKPSGTMWQVNCNGVLVDNTGNSGVFKDVTQCTDGKCANILQHNCTASEGQSGASMFAKDTLKINAILTGKLSTNSGNSYYVGTKMDAFVFDTLSAWYQEDAQAAAPAAPSSNAAGGGGPSGTGAVFPGSSGGASANTASASAAASGGSAASSAASRFPGSVGGGTAPASQASTLDSTNDAGSSDTPPAAAAVAAASPPPPPVGGRGAPGLFGIFGMYQTSRAPGGVSFQITKGEADAPDALFFNPLIVRRTNTNGAASLSAAQLGGGAAAPAGAARQSPF